MKFEKCEIADVTASFDGTIKITFKIPRFYRKSVEMFVDEYKDKELSAEIKEYKKHRSLDANGYYWKMCSELAAKTNIPVEQIESHTQYRRKFRGRLCKERGGGKASFRVEEGRNRVDKRNYAVKT